MKLTDLEKGIYASMRRGGYLWHRGTIPLVQEGVDVPNKLTLRPDLGTGTLEFELVDELLHTAQHVMATGEAAVVRAALFYGNTDNSIPVKRVVVEIHTAKAFSQRPEPKQVEPKPPAKPKKSKSARRPTTP